MGSTELATVDGHNAQYSFPGMIRFISHVVLIHSASHSKQTLPCQMSRHHRFTTSLGRLRMLTDVSP